MSGTQIPYWYFTKPMSFAYSRKQRRQMSRSYLRIRPRSEWQIRLHRSGSTGPVKDSVRTAVSTPSISQARAKRRARKGG
eukprot:scaffold16579_cov130-Isochrysis_galbana.AAC.3